MTKAQQTERVAKGNGFIAALDQSGGSTPKALRLYGVAETAYSNVANSHTPDATSPRFLSFSQARMAKVAAAC